MSAEKLTTAEKFKKAILEYSKVPPEVRVQDMIDRGVVDENGNVTLGQYPAECPVFEAKHIEGTMFDDGSIVHGMLNEVDELVIVVDCPCGCGCLSYERMFEDELDLLTPLTTAAKEMLAIAKSKYSL